MDKCFTTADVSSLKC